MPAFHFTNLSFYSGKNTKPATSLLTGIACGVYWKRLDWTEIVYVRPG